MHRFLILMLLVALTATAADGAELAVQSCSIESSLHSIDGLTPASVQFVNATGQTVTVYWINYTGARVFYRTLAAGQAYLQPTYLTHPWVVTAVSGACLAIFQPLSGSNTATVTPGGAATGSATVESVSGTVALRTSLSTGVLSAGAGLSAGSLIQTGGNGTAALTLSDGTRLVVDPDTQVTLLPPADPAAPETILNQIRGSLRHNRDAGVPGSGRYAVQTPNATVRPTGTEFSTRYTETNQLGSLVVAVQRGQVEVTNRSGQITTVVAGGQATFDAAAPRVSLILPVTRGFLVPGTFNTFNWTSFAGAAGYLLEYTVNPAGFAQPNASSPEAPASTLRLLAGAFSEAAGTVELLLSVPGGIIPPGLRIHWRVFPTDAAGSILAGTTASDASSFTALGSRVTTLLPVDGAVVRTGTTAGFTWTEYAGAAGYFFEYTLNPAGFAQVNPPAVESPAQAIRLGPGYVAYLISLSIPTMVQLSVPLPAGIVPSGTRAQWRVFPVDATGKVLPYVTGSDARTVILE